MASLSRTGSAVLGRALRSPLRVRAAQGCVARTSVSIGYNHGPPRSLPSTRSFHVSIAARGIMPDAENPPPRQPDEADHPTVPTDISTSEYHERADAYLDELVSRLEEKQEQSPDFEVEYSVRPRSSTTCGQTS
jgi:frataxin